MVFRIEYFRTICDEDNSRKNAQKHAVRVGDLLYCRSAFGARH